MSLERTRKVMEEAMDACQREALSPAEIVALASTLLASCVEFGVSESAIRTIFEKAMTKAAEQQRADGAS